MFGTLIDVGNDGNVFLQDKALALVPKLWAVYKKKGMGSKMVRWIVMVDDYKSPYRKKPLDERVELVTNIVFIAIIVAAIVVVVSTSKGSGSSIGE